MDADDVTAEDDHKIIFLNEDESDDEYDGETDNLMITEHDVAVVMSEPDPAIPAPTAGASLSFKSRKSYPISLKKKAIADLTEVHNGNRSACARAYGITTKMLRDWVKLGPAITHMTEIRASTAMRARHCHDPAKVRERGQWPEIDKAVSEWMLEQRRQKVPVHADLIRRKARIVAADKGIDFKASNGWLHNFLKRFNLVNPVTTPAKQ